MKKFKITLIGMLAMVMFLAAPASAEMEADQMGRQEQASIRVSELMDLTVHDQQGNEIGDVSDLVVSREGEVEFLIVSEGAQFLGLGEEDLIPIPWDMVQADQFIPDEDIITVNVDEQTLREAPTFTDDQWEAFTRGDMDQQVRGYYDERDHDRPMDDDWEMDQDDDEWGDNQ